jgi:hypothetical protein
MMTSSLAHSDHCKPVRHARVADAARAVDYVLNRQTLLVVKDSGPVDRANDNTRASSAT